MADILPRDLPPALNVPAQSAIIVDNGIDVEKATPAQLVNAGRPNATTAEAVAGSDTTKSMTPATTREAILALSPLTSGNVAGSLADLKAYDINKLIVLYDSVPWEWTPGDFSNRPASEVDVKFAQANGIPLSTGAWVRQGADKVRISDGGNVQDAIMAAANPGALLATTRAFPVGSVLRTADGFLYTVMSSGETDFHLTTAGGVKLRVIGPDFYLAAFALPGDNTDVTTLFGKALRAASNANGSLIGDGKRHRITSRININRTGKLALRVDLRGSTIFLDDGEIWFGLSDSGNPTSFLSTTLSADVAKGGKLLPMASTDGLAVGDLIQIESPAHSIASTPTFHSYIVETIDSGNVYIRGGFVADINAQQVIDSGASGPIVITAYKMAPGLVIENGKIEHGDVNGLRVGVNLTQQLSPLVQGLSCDGHTRIQIQIVYGTGDLVSKCAFRRYGYCDEVEPATTNPSAPDGEPFGYGLAHARNYQSTVRDCTGALGWHAFDAARGQMYIDYVECHGHRDAYTFATHECAWHVNYRGCSSVGRMGWTVARSIHPVLENCSGGIGGSTATNFIGLARSSNTVTVKGCRFIATTAGHMNVSNDSNPRPGVISAGDTFDWRIEGCVFNGSAPLTFGTPTGRTYIVNSEFLGGALFSEVLGATRVLDSVVFSGVHASFAVVVTGGSTKLKNVKGLTAATGSNTALLAVVGVPTSLELIDCETASQFLVRMLEGTATVKVNAITNCKAGWMVFGGANVTAANIVNTYRRESTLTIGGAVVTQSVNNIQLAT